MNEILFLLTICLSNIHVSAADVLTFERQMEIFAQYNPMQDIRRSDIQDPDQGKYGLILMQYLKITITEQEFKKFLEKVKQESVFLSELWLKAGHTLTSFDDSYFWDKRDDGQEVLFQFPSIRP